MLPCKGGTWSWLCSGFAVALQWLAQWLAQWLDIFVMTMVYGLEIDRYCGVWGPSRQSVGVKLRLAIMTHSKP